MTAPSSLTALIAEGRRLIAEATDREAKGFPSPLPWYVSGCHNMIWGDDGDAITGPEPYFERPVANLIVLAVNAFPALLAVAEAAVRYTDALDDYNNTDDGDFVQQRALLTQTEVALRAAIWGEEPK